MLPRSLHAYALLAASLAALPAGPAAALATGDRSIASAPRVLVGAAPGDAFGATVALPGDVTGDGVGDVLVGAPAADGGAGRVYLFSGADILASRALRAEDAFATFVGTEGAGLGTELAALGDVDGDGWPDWGAGAPRFPGGDAPPGRLFVLPGAATVADAPLGVGGLEGALLVLDGPNAGATLGEGFAGVGDLDGDGLADFALLVREQDTDSDGGALAVVRGRSAGNWPTTTDLLDVASAGYVALGFGNASLDFTLSDLVAPAGDLDGDGVGDLYLGLPGATGGSLRSGGVLALPGDVVGVVNAPEVALGSIVPRPGWFGAVDVVDAHFGQPVTTMPDGSLWVGVGGLERGGVAGFLAGRGAVPQAEDLVAAVQAPPGVQGAPRVRWADLDGDGVSSLLVAMPRAGEGPGQPGAGLFAVLPDVLGALHDVAESTASFEGLNGQRLGAELLATNLDGDGYDDAVLGAPGAFGSGAVYVLLGAELADGDGFAPKEGDCDDVVAAVYPGSLEVANCDDNLDNDCDGLIDADDPPCAVEGSGLVVGCSVGGSGGLHPWSALLLVGLLGCRRRGPRSGARRAVGAGLLGVLWLLAAGCPSADPGMVPSLRITDPLAGARLADRALLAVSVQVEGARLAPELEGSEPSTPGPDEPVVPRPVLWALSVDGFERARGGGPLLVAEGMTPGVHVVRAELRDTLGRPLEPAVAQEITVEIVAGNPSVAITTPADEAVVPPEGFEVTYDVGGFLLNAASIGGANQLGVGHAVLTVDGSIVALDTDGRAFVANLPGGEHTVAVELVNNDGTFLSPPVVDEIAVVVAEPSVTITAPTNSERLTNPQLQVTYEVGNFTLDPINVNGQPQGGRGHVHIYLDGLYRGLDATGSFAIPDVDGCGHTLRLELALGGHAELGIADSVDFTLEPCVRIKAPAQDGTVAGPNVAVAYTSPGFLVSAGSPPGAGERYVTMYVDGTYVGASGTAGNAAFSGLTPGPHTLELRLAVGPANLLTEYTGELSPPATASVDVVAQ